jgi:hypothetical protein
MSGRLEERVRGWLLALDQRSKIYDEVFVYLLKHAF